MNPDVPAHYQNNFKKYLPSKKIAAVLGLVAIIALGYFLVPPAIAAFRKSRDRKTTAVTAVAYVPPVGNPVTRDTLNDGIPDWEKIAVGLDPTDPNSTAAFEKIQSTTPDATMAQIENSSDTDKISYTLFNNIVNATDQTGTLDDSTITDQTNQELSNYVAALQPPDAYTDASLQSVSDTAENQATYKKQIAAIGPVNIFSDDFQADVSNYFSSGTDATTVLAMANEIQAILPKIVATPTPAGIVDDQVASLNALNAFSKIILAYDPTNTDPLYQYANISLIQMQEASILSSTAAILQYYGDPRGAVLQAQLDQVSQTIQANQVAAETPSS